MKSRARLIALSLLALILRFPSTLAAPPTLTVEDHPSIVFERTQRCERMDLPDAPLRAFRRADGMIVAFATHYLNRRLVGPSLSRLTHDCKVVYEGGHLADPRKFDDRTWIAATWTTDGVHVAALGHNEYQADQFSGQCKFKTYNECWYNAIVPLLSSNGGQSFARVDYPEPIAAAPMRSNAEQGHPRGYFNPSNIIFAGGYYYALIAREGFGGSAGRCLFRTNNVMSPESWTVWDGHSYVPIFGSPYDRNWAPGPTCQAVTGLSGYLGSIAKIKNTTLFAAFSLSESSEDAEGGYVDVYFSSDLLHWSDRQHLLSVTPIWSKKCPSGVGYSYPAVLSDSDEGRNFDTIGQSSWLFITKISCQHRLDRDLVRFPLAVHLDVAGAPTR